MPQALPIIIGVGGAAVAKTVIAKIIVGLVAAVVSAKLQQQEAKSALRRAVQQGVRYNPQSTVEPVPIVYGRIDRMPGVIAMQNSHEALPEAQIINGDTRHLTTMVVWSEGEIGGITDCWVNDWLVGGVKPSASFWLNSFDVAIQHYVGTDDQSADDLTVARFALDSRVAGRWTANHRLRGIAYSRFRLHSRADGWEGSGLPVFTASVRGILCTDWRSGLRQWTENPIVCLYDYLTNARYGCRIPADEIHIDSFTSAANYCDEVVAGEHTSGRPRYAISTILDPSGSRLDNIREILSTCRASLIYSAGEYKIKIDRPQIPVLSLDENNLTGDWSIQLDSYGQRFNQVTARYMNPAKGYKPDIVTVASDEYLAADGASLALEIDLLSVRSQSQASDLAQLAMRQSRFGAVVECTATLAALSAEVGDVVSLTHSVPGWTAKEFTIQSMTLKNNDEIALTLLEYSATIHEGLGTDVDVESPIGTDLPDPRNVPDVAGLSASSSFIRSENNTPFYFLNVNWTSVENDMMNGYDVQWTEGETPAVDAVWAAGGVNGYTITNFRAFGVSPGLTYSVRVRARGPLGSVGDWATTTAFVNFSTGNIQPVPSSSVALTGPGAGRISWVQPADTRVTDVEVWSSVGAFHDPSTPPALVATIPVGVGYFDVLLTGTLISRYFWLRARSPTSVASEYSPPTWSAGHEVLP